VVHPVCDHHNKEPIFLANTAPNMFPIIILIVFYFNQLSQEKSAKF